MKSTNFFSARMNAGIYLQFLAASLMLFCLSGLSPASLYPVTKITNNGPGISIDPWQFTVDVQNTSSSQVLLVFANNDLPSALTSSIKDIYIDDTLISFDSFVGLQPGSIEFSSHNGKLPGGTAYGFTSDDFCAAAGKAAPKKGLNPGESLGLLFNLNGASYTAINTAIGNGQLRVGMHVISIANGNSNVSESFIIPEPATLFLLGAGLLCVVFFQQHRTAAN